MNNISSITTAPSMPRMPTVKPTGGGDSSSFKDMLVNSIKEVNSMQTEADQAVEALFTGEDVNPAEVLTAVQKADLAFRLTMQMRNKAMDVYREIRDIRI
ncbi:flagellar hook-basal body complex protein FliE [Aeoliella sp.]|uniref:flagellar hook-basal body complex protein FliE n=1 Tax=Aeoliella sp. TaxID=2795800 RepID=UPI003CCBB0C8